VIEPKIETVEGAWGPELLRTLNTFAREAGPGLCDTGSTARRLSGRIAG
jgi:hypothetical protein